MLREMVENREKYPATIRRTPIKETTQFVYTPEQKTIAKILQGAKQRCIGGHVNYGARGIEFKFASIKEGVFWIEANIGSRPTAAHTLDRKDNNRHYEAGNLRWATRAEQANNKRPYKSRVYGDRLKALLVLRPDYTYEGLRQYINLGYTDAEILEMPKPTGGRKRKI